LVSARSTYKDRPESEAEPISGLLAAALKDLGLADKYAQFSIIAEWEAAAGPTLSKWAKAKRFQKGRLEIAVQSAVWRTQISFVKQDIIDRINKKLGKSVVKELVLLNQR
jgi:hypothetical protein